MKYIVIRTAGPSTKTGEIVDGKTSNVGAVHENGPNRGRETTILKSYLSSASVNIMRFRIKLHLLNLDYLDL